MGLRRVDIERIKGYGSKTIFVPSTENARITDSLLLGLGAKIGAEAAA